MYCSNKPNNKTSFYKGVQKKKKYWEQFFFFLLKREEKMQMIHFAKIVTKYWACFVKRFNVSKI